MCPYGTLHVLMAPYGFLWHPTGPNGTLRVLMAPYGS